MNSITLEENPFDSIKQTEITRKNLMPGFVQKILICQRWQASVS